VFAAQAKPPLKRARQIRNLAGFLLDYLSRDVAISSIPFSLSPGLTALILPLPNSGNAFAASLNR
jgi:hypothetical protein